jgi:hypothetical protein
LKSEEPKTFVMFADLCDLAKFLDFSYFLNQYTKNHNLLVIQNIVSGKHNFILYERKGSGLKILRIETISVTSGLEFQDNADEEYLNQTLKTLEII